MKKLLSTLVVFCAALSFGQTPLQNSSNGLFWPTGTADSSEVGQNFADHDYGFGGYWLNPSSARYTQDKSGAVQAGNYPTSGKYHLGFDILNPSGVTNQPVYALADGQVMVATYGASGNSQDDDGGSAWGNTSCTEIGYKTSTLPSDCSTYSRSGNAGLVIKYFHSDETPFYAVYGHLLNANQVPRGLSGGSTAPGTCSNPITTSTDISGMSVEATRPFKTCDIVLAGNLIGYTGDWGDGRHLHFSIAPFTQITSNMGRGTISSTTWPDDGSVTNCTSGSTAHNCFPTGDYNGTDGTYVNQVNPIDFITNSSNEPFNWMSEASGLIFAQGSGTDETNVWTAWLWSQNYLSGGVVPALTSTSPIKSVTIKLHRTSGDSSCYSQAFTLKLHYGTSGAGVLSTNTLAANSAGMKFDFSTNTDITPANLQVIEVVGYYGVGSTSPWFSPCNDWDTNVQMVGTASVSSPQFENMHDASFAPYVSIGLN